MLIMARIKKRKKMHHVAHRRELRREEGTAMFQFCHQNL